MPDLICENCGTSFWQGQGRPAKRCGRCRGGHQELYGSTHRAIKAAGPTYGQPCTRCGQPLLPGQASSPDHLDGGGPTDYAGWAHDGCNLSAGAAYGNALRAAAYRAAKGLPTPAPNGSRSAGPTPDDPPDGTVRERAGGGFERWSATYRRWVRSSRRW
jgi:hypothetical protein